MRARLAPEGLNIVLPVGGPAFDAACVGVGGPPLGALLPGAAGAIVVGDGGSSFFSRFQAARDEGDGGADPLDHYTRLRVSGVVDGVLGQLQGPGGGRVQGTLQWRIFYPFAQERPALPFQRLGHAAGLPPPGPFGIQIHPVYGPWWAYRALIIISASLDPEPALAASCADCHQPCTASCPGRAVSPSGFSPGRCGDHRRVDPGCRESCLARLSCPVGESHRYRPAQLAFHMNASFAQIWHQRRAAS